MGQIQFMQICIYISVNAEQLGFFIQKAIMCVLFGQKQP